MTLIQLEGLLSLISARNIVNPEVFENKAFEDPKNMKYKGLTLDAVKEIQKQRAEATKPKDPKAGKK